MIVLSVVAFIVMVYCTVRMIDAVIEVRQDVDLYGRTFLRVGYGIIVFCVLGSILNLFAILVSITP